MDLSKKDDHMDWLEAVDEVDMDLQSSTDSKKTGEELSRYIQEIVGNVKTSLDQNIANLTPWFFNSMPNIYYQTTPREEKVRHLSSIITGNIFQSKQTIELWDNQKAKVTYIGPGSQGQQNIDMTRHLQNKDVKFGSMYFSKDRSLFLSTFLKKPSKKVDPNNQHLENKLAEVRKVLNKEYPGQSETVESFLRDLDHDFVVYANVSRLRIAFRMFHHLLTHEGAHTFYEPLKGRSAARLTIGIKGLVISDVLENILFLINRYQFEVLRYFIVELSDSQGEPMVVMSLITQGVSGGAQAEDEATSKKMVKALRTLGWVDSDGYSQLSKEPHLLSLNGCNYIRGIASWIHILLGKENPYYFSEHKILTTFLNHGHLTTKLVDMFRLKFDPATYQGASSVKLYEGAKEEIGRSIELIVDSVEQRIFKESVKFTDHVLKTNYFLPTKTGLAFRLDPGVLDTRYYPDKPFGIFFIIGRDYRCFQVRWKDIARGGIRIVMPRSSTDHGYAIAGLFDEVYGLSYAQQLKNKDIPEGGSKAVLVLRPGGDKGRAARGAINALLDLLVSEDESHEERASRMVSYYHQEEIIYLGPDENMTNDLIVWTAEHAKRRGYPYASAFISSKPGEGINHKEFGVTSEGLNVYVDKMLHFLGIDPKKSSFTVKMTGGPDGDVAGNELKILHRNYGKNARVVAIADGYGAAYDPQGLDWTELLRLVEASASIAEFDKSRLSKDPGAFLRIADTPENIKIRNELHAVAEAHIFIPGGGRPYTVNERNVEKFFSPEGVPSCRAIVEGANIFFTKEAREILQTRGVPIIKDSSANKTGVICSSYEVIASLCLSREEFLGMKTEYVGQVIDILREKAALEADLLFREYHLYGGKKNLVLISMEISKVINQVTDALLEELEKHRDQVLADPFYNQIVLRHCPAILRDRFSERVLAKLPKAHKIAICASYMASFVVYREGLDWLQSLDAEELLKAVTNYLRNEQKAADLIQSVEGSSLKAKAEIVNILRKNATRELTLNQIG